MLKVRIATVSAAACLCLLTAIAAPLLQDSVDYSKLPPPPAELQQQLSAAKVSLVQAVTAAEKELNGKASSATMKLDATPPTIEVSVFAGDKAHLVVVDGNSGAIVSKDERTWLPGDPTPGTWIEKDGVRYYDIKVGEGEELTKPESIIQINYAGFLVDGKEFASSTQLGQPISVPLNQMGPALSGFPVGVMGMKVGGKRKMVLPPDKAYGEQGQPPQIPANAALIWDIELLAIDPWDKLPAVLPGDPVTGEPTKTESGLAYYELKVGEGEQPAGPETTVKVHYTGYTVDGKKFDSSVDRNEPASFALNGVIPGWTEGVGSMKVGGKRKLVIPYALAYGEGGRGPSIPPKATLIFDVELLEIVKVTDPAPVDPSVPPVTPPPPSGNPNGG